MTQNNKKILCIALACAALGMGTVSAMEHSVPSAPDAGVSPSPTLKPVGDEPATQNVLSRSWDWAKDHKILVGSGISAVAAGSILAWSEIKMRSLKTRMRKNSQLTRTARLRLQTRVENLKFVSDICKAVLVASGVVFVGNGLHRWADKNPKLAGNDWYKRWTRNMLFAEEHAVGKSNNNDDSGDSDSEEEQPASSSTPSAESASDSAVKSGSDSADNTDVTDDTAAPVAAASSANTSASATSLASVPAADAVEPLAVQPKPKLNQRKQGPASQEPAVPVAAVTEVDAAATDASGVDLGNDAEAGPRSASNK